MSARERFVQQVAYYERALSRLAGTRDQPESDLVRAALIKPRE